MAEMPNKVKVSVSIGRITDYDCVTKEWLLAHIADLLKKKASLNISIDEESGEFILTWSDK